MDQHHTPGESLENSPKRLQKGVFSENSTIAIYTILSILIKMQDELGLEAMLEYIDEYLRTIEKDNPRIKYAVSRALQLISLEKIYKEAVHEKK